MAESRPALFRGRHFRDEIIVLQLALWRAGQIRPRAISVDGHPAYPPVIDELKQGGQLGRNCQCRRSPYKNSIIEQDHRFVKKRVVASVWFRSVYGALNTIAGYKAMNINRKGQIRWLPRATSLAKCASLNTHSVSRPNLWKLRLVLLAHDLTCCDATVCSHPHPANEERFR